MKFTIGMLLKWNATGTVYKIARIEHNRIVMNKIHGEKDQCWTVMDRDDIENNISQDHLKIVKPGRYSCHYCGLRATKTGIYGDHVCDNCHRAELANIATGKTLL